MRSGDTHAYPPTRAQARSNSSVTLAPELLLLVFDVMVSEAYRPRKEVVGDLLSSCRVCRDWSSLALIFLYQRVQIRTPQSAQSFLETLHNSERNAALVQEIVCWTQIYEESGRIGRFSRARRWMPDLPVGSHRTCNDRFVDTVVRKCPNLKRFSMLNRTEILKGQKPIALPKPGKYASDLLSQLSSLELDATRAAGESGHWLCAAVSAGRLSVPNLEEFCVRSLKASIPGDAWAPFPSLRRLVLKQISLAEPTSSNHKPIQNLLLAASSLQELDLIRVEVSIDARLALPSRLKKVSFLTCEIPILQLPLLLMPCASSLEELDISTTFTTSEAVTWPAFPRLVQLSIEWDNIADWSIPLLKTAVHNLKALRVIKYYPIPVNTQDSETDTLSSAGQTVLNIVSSGVHPSRLESLHLHGNPNVDAHELAVALHSVSLNGLRTLSIELAVYINLIEESLLDFPQTLRELELHLGASKSGFTTYVWGSVSSSNRLLSSSSEEPSAENLHSIKFVQKTPRDYTGAQVAAMEIARRKQPSHTKHPAISSVMIDDGEDDYDSWRSPKERVQVSLLRSIGQSFVAFFKAIGVFLLYLGMIVGAPVYLVFYIPFALVKCFIQEPSKAFGRILPTIIVVGIIIGFGFGIRKHNHDASASGD